MEVVIWTNESGNVSVCWPTGSMSIADTKAKDTPEHSIIVDSESLPFSENDFFDAWELSNGVVSVSIVKAKEVTKTRLRIERTPLLAAQDVAFQRALETGADTSSIVAEKQRLRDVTNLADACTTTAELRALTV